MPAPVGQVYGLTPRDAAGALWGFTHKRLSTSGTSVTRSFGFNDFGVRAPPIGTILFITQIFAIAIPGSGQTVDDLVLSVVDPLGNKLSDLRESPLAEAFKRFQFDADIPLLIGQQGLQCVATYSAGVTSNALRLSWSGYVLPRGNVVAF